MVIPAQGSRAIILFITGAAGCRKYSSHPAQVLPPETHLGLNTMGAYVNGKLFIPQGSGTYPGNYYSASIGWPLVSLNLGWQDEESVNFTSISIDLDSIQLTQGTTYTLGTPLDSPYTGYAQWASFRNWLNGDIYNTSAQLTGQVTIDYYDPAIGIVSGNFAFDAVDYNSDTVHVTQGRFDMGLK